MKTRWLITLLTVLSGTAWAQVGELYNAEVNGQENISNPVKALKAAEGQWLAFNIPVIEDTHSPCCWKGKWRIKGTAGCSLETRHMSFGTHSESPLTDTVIVYANIRDGEVQKLRMVGEACPVDGGGAQVTWIGDVDDKRGIDWLENTARNKDGEGALYALALHRNEGAAKRLYKLAKDTNEDVGSEAVFWLGAARGEQGFELLKDLLAELPMSDRRREINFALSQNESTEAAELLLEISKTDKDREQRGEALFWLAQEYPHEAKAWLQEVIRTERDDKVLEQAIFAVSQLPGKDSGQMLLEIARDKQVSREARRHALFWLAQSDDDEAVAALAELLTH